MYVSARDRRILDELLAHPDGVTISWIAEKLDVSDRTIHRDLANFDTILRPYELHLEKKQERGSVLSGPPLPSNSFRRIWRSRITLISSLNSVTCSSHISFSQRLNR
ncbi:helix-turn-helix domain-containing protein [Alkalicoccus halolimnae]|uniref:HTH domain-containing protein n=1 Tax=Alkalicoccus halolimnae TaxID=1667239 RepID=UPI0011CB7AD7|nr:helix-turn-helix domain-containing protein [Alkalicoccus halolimnae]